MHKLYCADGRDIADLEIPSRFFLVVELPTTRSFSSRYSLLMLVVVGGGWWMEIIEE